MYLLYFAFWVIFNGNLTLEIAVFGLIIAALMLAFTCYFFDYSLQKEKKIWVNAIRLFKYVLVLIREIIKANLDVAHMILSEEEEREPVLVEFDVKLPTQTQQVLLANSITLTPGTITVELEEDHYLVHCLDKDLAAGMDQSVFVENLKELDFVTDNTEGKGAK